MSHEQREWGVQSLYEEGDVRDELTDEEAQTLLTWAEEQVAGLAAQDLDDAAFETALAHLKRLMRGMNRFSARLADLSPEDQQAMLAKMQVSASAVGLNPPTTFSAQTVAADPYDVAGNLRALMAAFGGISAASAAPDTPAAPAAPDTPAAPAAPDTPAAPAAPDTPGVSAAFAAPGTPTDMPNAPGMSAAPAAPDTPTDTPNAPDTSDTPPDTSDRLTWDSL